MRVLRVLLCALAAVLTFPAAASFHLFQIDQLYSNADGSIQFIVLKECCGQNGEHLLKDHALTSKQGATTNSITFPNNLPSSNTANRSVLIATPGFAALGLIAPDYTVPAGFLFINGATVNYAGVDAISYAALPTDGVNALRRDGTVGPNLATNFAGATASVVPPPTGPATITVVEYHHASFDHYFITPVPAEIALLDARAPPFEEWSRTGFTFNVYVNASAPGGSVPICRFFNDHFAKSSHFYGPPSSCQLTLAMFPDWTLEEDKLFNTMLSDVTGACPAGTIPVYRLFNNGMGGAPNHRFVTSLTERQNMVNQGWTGEGNGIGVETCVPM